jgi:hypothetical protein
MNGLVVKLVALGRSVGVVGKTPAANCVGNYGVGVQQTLHFNVLLKIVSHKTCSNYWNLSILAECSATLRVFIKKLKIKKFP